MTLKIKKKCLKWLQKHRNRRKIIKAKVLPVKTTRARARVLPVHVQNLQFVISAEKATFQREKCFAML